MRFYVIAVLVAFAMLASNTTGAPPSNAAAVLPPIGGTMAPGPLGGRLAPGAIGGRFSAGAVGGAMIPATGFGAITASPATGLPDLINPGNMASFGAPVTGVIVAGALPVTPPGGVMSCWPSWRNEKTHSCWRHLSGGPRRRIHEQCRGRETRRGHCRRSRDFCPANCAWRHAGERAIWGEHLQMGRANCGEFCGAVQTLQ